MKARFDRQEYLAFEEVFEVGQLDDVTKELCEFSDDIEDMAYALAYTRYALAKVEARHNELVEAVKWERECEDVAHWRYEVWEMAEVGSGDCEIYTVAQCIHDAARAEVDRLIWEVMCAD